MASEQHFSASASVSRQATSYGYTDFDLSSVFPNNTAKPIKADFYVHVHRDYYFLLSPTATARIEYNGVNKCSVSSNKEAGTDKTETGDTAAEITGHAKGDTSARIGTVSSFGGCTARAEGTITLYFTRYDFAANGSTGVTASVDRPTGYDGDTIIFTATVQNGYAFDGWYDGASKVSGDLVYQHTVSGGDLSLTAKAVPTTKTITIQYNGTMIATETGVPPFAIAYNGETIASVGSGETKTLQCGGKVMRGNVTVGGKTLTCDGKVMNGNIAVSVS